MASTYLIQPYNKECTLFLGMALPDFGRGMRDATSGGPADALDDGVFHVLDPAVPESGLHQVDAKIFREGETIGLVEVTQCGNREEDMEGIDALPEFAGLHASREKIFDYVELGAGNMCRDFGPTQMDAFAEIFRIDQ